MTPPVDDKNTIIEPTEMTDKPAIDIAKPIPTPTAFTVPKQPSSTAIVQVNPERPIKRYNFRQVDDVIQSSYYYECDNNSTICDVIAMYLMGQKILYTEAKTHCEQHLNVLMLPAIFVTAVCAILSLVLKDYFYGPIIVSSLNGVNAFILAVINYLKLDGKAEAHRTTAYKFDKLQANMVFMSGKMLFMKEAHDEMKKIIEDLEKDVREIKETNQFILPEKIRINYPRLYSMNVFAEVKKINNKEMLIVNNIKDTMNEIMSLNAKVAKQKEEGLEVDTQIEIRIKELEDRQKRRIEDFIRLKDNLLEIDKEFEKEMGIQRAILKRSYNPWSWLKT